MFSAFYLLLILLVALIVRNMGFEYRGKRDDDTWRKRWDWAIIGGSIVAPLLVGVALTNVVRGLPIDQDMEFTGNLFTLLNPMSLLGGLVVLGLSLTHGLRPRAQDDRGHPSRRPALGTTLGLGTALPRGHPAAVARPGPRAPCGRGSPRRSPRSLVGGDRRERPGPGGLGLHRHRRDDGQRRRYVLPRALPERHADDPRRGLSLTSRTPRAAS